MSAFIAAMTAEVYEPGYKASTNDEPTLCFLLGGSNRKAIVALDFGL